MEKIDPYLKDLAYIMRQCAEEDKSDVLNLMIKATPFRYSKSGGALTFDQMLSSLEEMISGNGCGKSK